MKLKFTFADQAAAELVDLTRIGPVVGGSRDGLTAVVEAEDDWMTVDNAQLILLIFRADTRIAVDDGS